MSDLEVRKGGGCSMREPPFFGREREMEAFAQMMEGLRSGHGSVLMISGSAGIGKTRLLHEMIKTVSASGLICLQGRCHGDDPAPLVALNEVTAQLITLRKEGVGLDGSLNDWNEQKTMLVQDLLALAHESPVLLALEDLQWADSSTLNFIHSLGRRIQGSRLILVGTYRDHDVEERDPQGISSLRDVINVLRKQVTLIELGLDRLSEREMVMVVEGYLGGKSDDEVHRVIADQSHGSPLFLVESLRMMMETKAIFKRGSRWRLDETKYLPLSPEIEFVVTRRLGKAPSDHVNLLRLLSVLGPSSSSALAQEVLRKCTMASDVPLPSEIPCDLAMVRQDGGTITFEHEMVRRAIYEGMDGQQRREFHHAIADTLTSWAGSEAGHPILSYHFYNANDWLKAMNHSYQAAGEALSKQAHREAELYYERALHAAGNLPQRMGPDLLPQINEGLGDLHYSFARFDTSIHFLTEALEMADDNDTRARLLRKLSCVWGNKDDFVHLDKAWQLIEEADRMDGVSYDERTEISCAKSIICFYRRDFEMAIEYSSQVRDRYDHQGKTNEAFWETVHIGMFYQQMGRTEDAWKEMEEAGRIIEGVTLKEALMEYFTLRAEQRLARGSYEDCIITLDRLISLHDDLGFYADISYDHWMKGLVLSLVEDHEGALMEATDGVKFAMIDEMRRAVIRSNALLAHEHLMLGDIRSAEEVLEKNALLAEEEGLSSKSIGTGLFWVVLAELHQMKGAKGLAEMEIDNGLAIIDKNEITPMFGALARFWYGVTLSLVGDSGRSRATLEDAVQRYRALSNWPQEKLIIDKHMKKNI